MAGDVTLASETRRARFTGGVLLLTTVVFFIALIGADPGIEEHDNRERFIDEVAKVADRVPWIGIALGLQAAMAGLAVAVGVGLYLLARRRAPGLALGGMIMLLLWGLFSALQAMFGGGMVIAAQDYLEPRLIEAESDAVLELLNVMSVPHVISFLATWIALALAVGAFSLAYFRIAPLGGRWFGWVGVVAAVAVLLFPVGFALEPLFGVPFVGALVLLLWLVGFGIWLIVRAERVAADALALPEEPAGPAAPGRPSKGVA
ncbi:hypothetical protein GL263_11930 [Streptomyces durbertensis]|uniref:DUF4386 family protein n=1 Tax=Streptomyces durbertensis TaxID=2448886 RepID=A0ABR6EFZ5_9ACTN|nr:hypothetical protein [Streptomyces durbertensis]MBB1244263.1 hypothetical protein [Streptomyces durbertensis]